MRNKITKNWGLKLGSFLFAVTLWIVVTNINDPISSVQFSEVPVTIRNADLITERGQVFEVLDGTNTIDTVTVFAPRSIIDTLDKSNVVATADVAELSSLDTIAIRLSTNKYNDKLESISGNIDSVKLKIEEKQTRSLPIRANVSGEVREGYILGDVSTEQNLLRISGPKSVVSQIATVQADVDVSGFTSNIGTDADLRLYDADGNEIDADGLERNITKVRVNIEILETRTVPVNFTVSGEPADGYRLTGDSESTKASVVIAGRSSILKNTESIEIPEGVIDVTGATEDVVTQIDLREYLPDGVRLAEEGFDGTAEITVFVGQEVRRTLSVAVEDIRVKDVPAGYEAVISETAEHFTLAFRGLTSEFQEISLSELEVSVSVAQWLESTEMEEPEDGYYRLPLSVGLPEDSAITWEEQEVLVHITARE